MPSEKVARFESVETTRAARSSDMMLLEGSCCVMMEGDVDDPLLESRVVARDQLVIVIGPDHDWAQAGSSAVPFSPARLAESDWVLREAGSGTRSVFEAALEGFGVAPAKLRVVLELPSNESVRAAVEAGMGATAISASVAAPSIEAGLLHTVDLALPERTFHVLRHEERYRSQAADALLAIIAAGRPITASD